MLVGPADPVEGESVHLESFAAAVGDPDPGVHFGLGGVRRGLVDDGRQPVPDRVDGPLAFAVQIVQETPQGVEAGQEGRKNVLPLR